MPHEPRRERVSRLRSNRGCKLFEPTVVVEPAFEEADLRAGLQLFCSEPTPRSARQDDLISGVGFAHEQVTKDHPVESLGPRTNREARTQYPIIQPSRRTSPRVSSRAATIAIEKPAEPLSSANPADQCSACRCPSVNSFASP